jgi:hypothetical protein
MATHTEQVAQALISMGLEDEAELAYAGDPARLLPTLLDAEVPEALAELLCDLIT